MNTLLDSVYHFGFQIDAAGNFLNQDGDANTSLQVVAMRLVSQVGKIDLVNIDLVNIDANFKVAGDQGIHYIGSAAFSGVAGQLRLANQILSGDVNGESLEDCRLGLTGVSALLSATDLRL